MNTSYTKFILELLSPYGSFTARSMFGGYGIYMNGIIVAIIANDELYFKVDSTNQQQYEELDSTPFSYKTKGKKAVMSYWKVPIEILEEEKQLEKWIEQSFEISLKNKQNKKRIPNHKLQSS